MRTEIHVTVREVYGEKKVYPHCEVSKLFAKIANTKTLTHETLCYIEELGYLIQVKTETYNWR